MRLDARLRAAVLSLTILSGAVAGAAALAGPGETRLAVTLDGAFVARSGLDRGERPPLVALDSLAVAAGWHVLPLSSGACVQGNDRTVYVTTGSRTVREESSPHYVFAEPPLERTGRLYLAASDAARLFGLTLVRARGVLAFRHPVQLDAPAQIVEIPTLPAPVPRAVAVVAREAAAGSAVADALAGRVLFSMDRNGTSDIFRVTAETHGPYVQSRLDSTGFNQLGAPTGTVTLGTKDRNVQFGGLADPLNGLVLHAAGGNGIDVYDAGRRRDVLATKRLGDGRTMVGLVSGAPGNTGSDVVAVLFRNGAYDQTILRRLRVVRKPWGDFSRELLVGERGIGAAIRARTHGRTFVESTISFATAGLRLGPNDAPISVDAGRELSPATTLAGGFASGPHQPLAPFFALSSRGRSLTAGFTATNRTISGSLAYRRPNVVLQLYAIPGPQHETGAQARLDLRGLTVEAVLTSATGTREASLEARTAHSGINLVAGAAIPTGGRVGPVAGISVPLGQGLAVEAATRPTASGRQALRLSLAVGIPARHPRRTPTLPALVRVASASPLPPLQLFVDGMPALRFDGPVARVNVTPGVHSFSAESVDGSAGTRESSLNVAAAGDSVELVLLPERTISGYVRADPAASVAADFSLGGLIVVVQPENITTETAADGSFVFAKQPFAPTSTIGIDSGALPRTLRAPDPAPLPLGDAVLTLGPGLPIERGVFR
jgi:hypothetical protein